MSGIWQEPDKKLLFARVRLRTISRATPPVLQFWSHTHTHTSSCHAHLSHWLLVGGSRHTSLSSDPVASLWKRVNLSPGRSHPDPPDVDSQRRVHLSDGLSHASCPSAVGSQSRANMGARDAPGPASLDVPRQVDLSSGPSPPLDPSVVDTPRPCGLWTVAHS